MPAADAEFAAAAALSEAAETQPGAWFRSSWKAVSSEALRSGSVGIAASCTIRKNRALPRISSPWVMVSWQGTSPATAHICRVRVTVARSFANVPVWEKLLPSGLVPSMVTIAPSGRFGAPEGAVRRKISVRLWLSFCATGMRRGGVLGDKDRGRVRVSIDSGSFLFGGRGGRIKKIE